MGSCVSSKCTLAQLFVAYSLILVPTKVNASKLVPFIRGGGTPETRPLHITFHTKYMPVYIQH